MSARAKWDKARAAVLAARRDYDDRRRALEFKYGGITMWASAGEKKSLERLRAGMDRDTVRLAGATDRALAQLTDELCRRQWERAYLAHAWRLLGQPVADRDYIHPLFATAPAKRP